MEDFIQSAAQEVGISTSDAGRATGGLLSIIRENASSSDFGKLLEAMPGAEETMRAAEADEKPSSFGGVLGGAMQAASSFAGGKAGAALSAAGLLERTGLSADQAPAFIAKFVEHLRGGLDGDLVQRIIGSVPQIKNLVG